jgi:hypothetical protein
LNFLLDTNIVSETRRPRPSPKIAAWLAQAETAETYISALTLGEISRGVALHARKNPAEARRLEHWLASTRLEYQNRIIGVDADIAETWGLLDAKCSLPIIDGLLAATALVRGMTLVTRNVRDFARAGVELLNPWEV